MVINDEKIKDIVGKYGIDIGKEDVQCIFEDAVGLILKSYRKILKVNLNDDTFVSIKLQEQALKYNFSEWVRTFTEKGNVYYQDVNDFLDFISNENIRSYFNDVDSKKRVIRYRRLCLDGCYRWVALYVFPATEFTRDNKIVFLCVRDIQDDYDYQLSEQRKIQYLSTHDAITGSKNRLALMEDLNDIKDLGVNSVIRLRGIKNDLSNNEVVQRVEKINGFIESALSDIKHETYTMSLDECLILCSVKKEDNLKFISKVNTLKGMISGISYLGYSYSDSDNVNFNRLMLEAEEIMLGE